MRKDRVKRNYDLKKRMRKITGVNYDKKQIKECIKEIIAYFYIVDKIEDKYNDVDQAKRTIKEMQELVKRLSKKGLVLEPEYIKRINQDGYASLRMIGKDEGLEKIKYIAGKERLKKKYCVNEYIKQGKELFEWMYLEWVLEGIYYELKREKGERRARKWKERVLRKKVLDKYNEERVRGLK